VSEVVVVGAGIVGAACASELAARGVDVLLGARREVAGGTTGLGEGNVLLSDKDAGPELELARHGRRLYDELDARLGAVARIRRKGALIVHLDAATWEAEAARLARLGDVEHELIEDVTALEPALTGALHGAVRFPGDLQVDARAIARALAADVPVRTGCRVDAIAVERGRVVGVDTAEGRIAAGAVVLAAGPWSAALSPIPLPLEPRKGQLVRLRTPGGGRVEFLAHKVVDGSYLASVVSPAEGLQVTTVIETTWDGDVLVGSSRERRGFDLSVDPAVSEAMLARAARLAPGLRALPVADAWAGLRPWLPDHLPAIGRSEAVAGLWVATGHEGAGVALGPVTGRLLAQAYAGETPLCDLAPFAPDRFSVQV
jgi:glycine/D-amino acid oxidase-like deaminating enzyme